MLLLGYGCVPLALYDACYGLLGYSRLSLTRSQSLACGSDDGPTWITLAATATSVSRAQAVERPKVYFAKMARW